VDKDAFLRLITSGHFILFLDGFDEIAYDARESVTGDLLDFITKGFGNWFIIASRQETALASFGQFKAFNIQPLTREEAFDLLRKYDESQEHAEALIKTLSNRSTYEKLKDLMENPLLVSLLFKAYSYKPKIPFKKHIFYRQVFDALFDMHDSTKSAFVRKKHCELDIDEFHLIMRDLGFNTAKLGKIEYEKDEIISHIKEVKDRNNTILFSPAAFLNDLTSTVPLFNKDGQQYKWAHKSVQDYFASQYIAVDAKQYQEKLLDRIYKSGRCAGFENLLDLFHDTDAKTFQNTIMRGFLEDFVTYYETAYNQEYPGVTGETVEKRKQFSFGLEPVLFLTDLNERKKKTVNIWVEDYLEYFIQEARKTGEPMQPITAVNFQFRANTILTLAARVKRPATLLSLLCQKEYSFIKKAQYEPASFEELEHLISGEPIPLDDDPASGLNKPGCFEAVTAMLGHFGCYLNYENARRTLDRLNREVKTARHSQHILDGL
jgi:hypothetical protein